MPRSFHSPSHDHVFGEKHKSWSSSECSFLQSPVTSSYIGPVFSSAHTSPGPSVYVLPLTNEAKIQTRFKQRAELYCCIFSFYILRQRTKRKKDTQQNATSHSAYLIRPYVLRCGPGKRSRYSDSLLAGRSGDRIPVGGEIFLTRPDRSWGPPSLLHNGYRLAFSGVKRPGRGVDHPPHRALRLKKE